MLKTTACPYCGKTPRSEHSLREGGICDGLRSGKIKKVGDRLLLTHDNSDVVPRKRRVRRIRATAEAPTKGKK